MLHILRYAFWKVSMNIELTELPKSLKKSYSQTKGKFGSLANVYVIYIETIYINKI